jgi:hypothetical protein
MAQINLDSQVPNNWWESRFTPDELIRASHEDPSLWAAQSATIANYDVNLRNGAIAWQEAAQLALKNIAPVSGFPSATVPTVVSNVGAILIAIPSGISGQELAIKIAQAGIGIAMIATAAIPIVGAIVNALGAVALFLISLFGKKREEVEVIFPPMAQYSEENDTWVGNNQALPALATLDWTRLFMPRHAGDWRVFGRAEKGIEARPFNLGTGLGMMPGTQRLTSAIQVFWIQRGHAAEVSPELSVQHNDVGSFYPGTTQMVTAVMEQIAKPQTQMYNVNTDQILSAWENHIEGAFELAAGIYERRSWAVKGTPLADQTLSQNRVFAQNMVAPFIRGAGGKLDVLSTNWTPEQGIPKNTALEFIRPWCATIRRQQWNNLGRVVGAAYTDPTQPAFRNAQLYQKLKMMRQALLEHQARKDVVLADVIDPEYRAQLFDSTVGDTLTAATPVNQRANPKIDPDTPADPPPPGVGGGVPFGGGSGSGLGRLALLGGAAVGLAMLAKRRRWFGLR